MLLKALWYMSTDKMPWQRVQRLRHNTETRLPETSLVQRATSEKLQQMSRLVRHKLWCAERVQVSQSMSPQDIGRIDTDRMAWQRSPRLRHNVEPLGSSVSHIAHNASQVVLRRLSRHAKMLRQSCCYQRLSARVQRVWMVCWHAPATPCCQGSWQGRRLLWLAPELRSACGLHKAA